MNGVLLDPRTGRPEADRELPGFDDVMTLKHTGARPPRIIPIKQGDDLGHIRELLDKSRENPGIRAYTRNKQYVGARPAAATAATARVLAANCWNPAAAARIWLYEIWCVNTTVTAFPVMVARTTARGTASTSVALVAANSIENDVAAPSGVVIDTAWSVAPTVSAADFIRWNVPGAVGNGFIIQFPDPIALPAGTGLGVGTPVTTAFQISDFTFVIGD